MSRILSIAPGACLLAAAWLLGPVAPVRAADDEADDAVIEMVGGLLSESDRDMRALGLQQVREEVPGAATTRKFAAMLPKLPPDVQAGLLEALGDRGDAAARPAVVQMLQSKDGAVRAAALKALGPLGGAADVSLLAGKAAAGAEAEKKAARGALARLRGDGVNAAIVTALDGAAPSARVAMLGVLAARNAREAVPTVLRAAADPDPAVRLAALAALRYLAGEQHAAALIETVRAAPDEAERRQAELALLALASRERQKCAQAVIGAMAGADAPSRVVLLRAVARAGGPDAVAAIAARLKDGDETVRDEAVRLLASLADPAAVPHLSELLKSDNLRHQVLAARGLARLTGGPKDVLAELEAKAAKAFAPSPAGEPPPVGKLAPIEIVLPQPAFRGTPVPLKEPNVEKPLGKPRAPFLAPEGTVNLARGKPVCASDPAPASGELDYVTDGDKEASDFGYLELRPGSEWVQIDLGRRATIYAVLVWHSHAEARVYRDVIVQISDDPDFLAARTVFNNDYDNSSGLGAGKDQGYVETSEGKLIDARGVEGRYVRLWSRGSNIDPKNHYTEVEVFGRPLP